MSLEGVAIDPFKVCAIKDWPTLRGVKELQVFLGTVGYYRQYLKDFATDARPLYRFTAKRHQFDMGCEYPKCLHKNERD